MVFGGDLAVDGGADDVAPLLAAFFGATDLPTVTYLRIFSMRFGPMPLLARKSSTLVNWPYDWRIFTILSAVDGARCQELAATPVQSRYSDSPAAAAVFCLYAKQAR